MGRAKKGPPPRGYAGRPGTEPDRIPRPTIREHTLRVYVAAPLVAFDSPRYREAIRTLRRLLPDVDLIEAKQLFRNTQDWKRRWPRVLREIDHLVFVADSDRTIGAGVFQELLDAHPARRSGLLPRWPRSSLPDRARRVPFPPRREPNPHRGGTDSIREGCGLDGFPVPDTRAKAMERHIGTRPGQLPHRSRGTEQCPDREQDDPEVRRRRWPHRLSHRDALYRLRDGARRIRQGRSEASGPAVPPDGDPERCR